MDMDQVEFGKLIQAVSNLTEKVMELEGKVNELQSTISGGRGIVFGMLLAAGGLGAWGHEVLAKIFER